MVLETLIPPTIAALTTYVVFELKTRKEIQRDAKFIIDNFKDTKYQLQFLETLKKRRIWGPISFLSKMKEINKTEETIAYLEAANKSY